MDTEVTDTPITTVETVITTNEDIPGETIGECVEAETLTEVSLHKKAGRKEDLHVKHQCSSCGCI